MQAEVNSCGTQPRFFVILLLNGAENHPAFLKCSEHDSITALPPRHLVSLVLLPMMSVTWITTVLSVVLVWVKTQREKVETYITTLC